MQIGSKLKGLFWSADRKRREFAAAAAQFGFDYPHAFVLIADPDTDVILMQFKGIQVPVRFVHPETKKRMSIVKNALAYNKQRHGNKAIDQFLMAVDSGLFNIAKELYNVRKRSIVGRGLRMAGFGIKGKFETAETDGLVKSPLQPINDIDQDAGRE